DPSYYPDDLDMPALEDIVYSDYKEDVGVEADLSNLETNIYVSPILTTKVHKDHPVTQIIGDLTSAPQTRSMARIVKEQGRLNNINDEDFHICMFACFISQEEPKKVHQVLKDPSWIKAMREELLQFKMQKEEGIDYDEVFTLVERIEAIWLFLAYASFMGFMVYQMDVKNVFLYGTIEEEVYVCQPSGFEDPDYPDKVYKVVKALYGLHQVPRAWYETLANYLLENGFQKGKIDQTLFIKKQKGLQVKQKYDGIFISQDKYVAETLRKFGFTYVKSASTPIETEKPLLKDHDGEDVDVHIYRSMIGSLMYLTSSKPDIMFVVCACARFQVTPKVSYLHAVKTIFKYLKGKPHLGLWYPKDSPFNLVAYSNRYYARASLDRKSTTGGCQFLGCRMISWQCKKQIVVATSSTEAEYVAAASCCAQVLWIQNQLLDYGHFIAAVNYQLMMFGLTKDAAIHLMLLGFNQIVDFLNAQVIQYALMVNPTIYVSFIKKFWVTASIKKVNDVVKLQALINKKKVVIIKDVIRQDLCLDDADGNEFSCSIASAIICLTTEEEDDVEVPAAPTLPSPTNAPSPALHDPILTSLQAQPATPSSPPQEQPNDTSESFMTLLNNLMETCATLSQKVAELEQDKQTQALEIPKLKKRVKKLEKNRKSKHAGLKRLRKVGTSQKGRIDDDSAATKDVNAVEPTVFDDEDYDDKEENIDWNAIAEKIQEKHLDNIRKYQSLKRKPVSIAQARKNMIIYLKNMAGYKMEHFRGMTYDKRLVKEKFSSAVPNVDKEKALQVELKRLFEPDADDVLWKLQRYMHYPITWRLYSNYEVHQVSLTTRRYDMFMLTEKNYPLSNGVMTLMLSEKLQVEDDSNMARDLVMKIFMKANKPKSKSLDTSSK
nr:hypothetical protein [Tanacetum cinerariifolium]